MHGFTSAKDNGDIEHPPSLRSKRFQSSYCAKVRAEAKKKVVHFFFALVPAS